MSKYQMVFRMSTGDGEPVEFMVWPMASTLEQAMLSARAKVDRVLKGDFVIRAGDKDNVELVSAERL